ncbi:MAG: hypothetical protein ACR2PA_15225 [Hyphomicrobiaceae bacterium]
MAEQEPKQPWFDNSWLAWKDRLGIMGVLIALLLLFFFMFTDASLNFQCSVTDFITFKCNRFDREFKPWDQLEKKPAKSSFVPSVRYPSGQVLGIRWKENASA